MVTIEQAKGNFKKHIEVLKCYVEIAEKELEKSRIANHWSFQGRQNYYIKCLERLNHAIAIYEITFCENIFKAEKDDILKKYAALIG